MSDDLISKYIDRVAFASDTKFAIAEVENLYKAYLNAKKNLDGASGTKDIAAATGAVSSQVKGLTVAIEQQTQAIGANSVAQKKSAQDAVNASKQKIAALKLEKQEAETNFKIEEIERKKKVIADKEAEIQNKKNAAEQSAMFREKLVLLKEQQKEEAKLADINSKQVELSAKNGFANKRAQLVQPASSSSPVTFIPTKAIDKATLDLIQLQRGLASNKSAQDALSKSFKDGAISIGEYNQRLVALKNEQREYANNIGSANLALKNATREDVAAKGSLEARRAALIRLSAAYDNLSQADRSTPQGQRLQSVVTGLTSNVKTLEAETGRAQRNVGNYGSAVGAVFQKSFGFLRTLANIIPGLGIGGLIGFAIGPIVKYVQSIFGLSEAVKAAKIDQEEFNKTLKSTETNALVSGIQLKSFVAIARDQSLSLNVRNEALKEANKILGDHGEKLTLVNIATKAVTEEVEKFTQATIQQALASKFADRAADLIIKQRDATKDYTKALNDRVAAEKALKEFNPTTSDAELGGSSVFSNSGDLITANKNVKKTSEAYKLITKNLKETVGDLSAAQTTSASLFASLGTKDPSSKKRKNASTEKTIPDLIKELNTEFDIYKIHQARLIELFKEDADNQKLPLEKRLDALNNFFTESKNLINQQEEFDKEAKRREAQREIDNLNKDKTGKSTAQVARINANIKIIEKNLQQELLLIEAKGNDDRIKAGKTFGTERVAIIKNNAENVKRELKDELDLRKQNLEDETTVIRNSLETQYNDTLTILNELFLAGKISKEKLNAEKLKADLAFQEVSLRNEIEYQRNLIKLSRLSPAEKKAALDELDVIERGLSKRTATATKDISVLSQKLSSLLVSKKGDQFADQRAKLDEYLVGLKQIGEIADRSFAIVNGLINASITRQRNKLAQEKDEIDKKAEAEIAAITASSDAEEKKAAKIAIINARTASQKEAIARKEKQFEIDKAKFDKAQAIFNIILSTAVAVISAKTIVGRIVAAATGAASLAVAIATPIPRFKTGKNNDYEGPAIVGDGGVSEYIERADGSLEKTPAKDTLTYLGKDDIVHPDLMSFMMSRAMPALPTLQVKNNGDKKSDMIYAELKKISNGINIVANKRENHLSAKDGALVSLWKHGANTVKYFDEQTNW